MARLDHLGITIDAGWSTMRGPKEYPRFSRKYYAAFVEDDNGIRLELHQSDES